MNYKREDIIDGIRPTLELLFKGDIPLDMAEKHLADHIIALLEIKDTNSIPVKRSPYKGVIKTDIQSRDMIYKLQHELIIESKEYEEILISPDEDENGIIVSSEKNEPLNKIKNKIKIIQTYKTQLDDWLNLRSYPGSDTEVGKWLIGDLSELDKE